MRIAGVALLCACWMAAGYIVGATSHDGLKVPESPRSVFVTRDAMTVESSIGLGKHDIPAGSEFFIEVLAKGDSPVAHLTGNCGFVTPDGREVWCVEGDEIAFPQYAPEGEMVPTPEVMAAIYQAREEEPLPPLPPGMLKEMQDSMNGKTVIIDPERTTQ